MDALYLVNNALHGVLGQINQGATGFLNGKGVLQDCGSRPAADQLGCDVGALLGAALELGGDDGGIDPGDSKIRAPWELTREGASAIVRGGPFNSTYLQSASDHTWWTRDLAGHGGAVFKVYEGTPTGLQWIHDADQYGKYIPDKWKGGKGYFIPWSQLGRG